VTSEAWPPSDQDVPETTYDLLVRSAARFGDKPALHLLAGGPNWRTPTTWTYNDMLGRVTQAANMYLDIGLPAGGVVGLLLPNTAASYPALLGAQAVGIVNPVNPMLATEHVIDIFSLTGAKVLVAPAPSLDAAGWSKACEVLAALPDITALITVGGGPVPDPPDRWVGDFEQLSMDRSAARLGISEHRSSSDFAAYFHTGGTTGTPKVAPHTHASEIYLAWALGTHGAFGGEMSVLSGLPLFHVNAVIVTTLTPLLAGGTTVALGTLGFRDREAVAAFWQIVERYRVTTLSAVPTVYASLPPVPRGIDISSLRAGIVGAASLPTAVRTNFEATTGVPMLEAYGLTEATCASTIVPMGDTRCGSVGLPLPYQLVKAVRLDDQGRPAGDCPVGEVGVLAISGPAVFPGYLRHGHHGPVPEPTGVIADGWLLTGDLGRVGADGFVYLSGRAKDLIIRGGHNIDPRLIEEALLSHPDVAAVAAVPRPDAHSGEVPVAYVVLRPGATSNADTLRRWATTHCPEPASVPKFFHIVDAIPVTAVGKVHKVPLRHDSIRRAVQQELDEARLSGQVVVADVDGRAYATVRLPAGVADERLTGIEKRLSRYGIGYKVDDSGTESMATAVR